MPLNKKKLQLYKQLHELGTRDFTKVKLSVKLLDLFTNFYLKYSVQDTCSGYLTFGIRLAFQIHKNKLL